jgi:hypothetical protein
MFKIIRRPSPREHRKKPVQRPAQGQGQRQREAQGQDQVQEREQKQVQRRERERVRGGPNRLCRL